MSFSDNPVYQDLARYPVVCRLETREVLRNATTKLTLMIMRMLSMSVSVLGDPKGIFHQ